MKGKSSKKSVLTEPGWRTLAVTPAKKNYKIPFEHTESIALSQ